MPRGLYEILVGAGNLLIRGACSRHFTSLPVMSCHLFSCLPSLVTSCMSGNVTSRHVMVSYHILSLLISSPVMSCYAGTSHLFSGHVRATSSYAMPYYVISSSVMFSHVMALESCHKDFPSCRHWFHVASPTVVSCHVLTFCLFLLCVVSSSCQICHGASSRVVSRRVLTCCVGVSPALAPRRSLRFVSDVPPQCVRMRGFVLLFTFLRLVLGRSMLDQGVGNVPLGVAGGGPEEARRGGTRSLGLGEAPEGEVGE